MNKNNRLRDIEVENGYKMLNQIVKEQNRILLYEIARFKKMNQEETEEFVKEYLKSNYYMLEITGLNKKEQMQRNFIY
jgi:hypothetical protein